MSIHPSSLIPHPSDHWKWWVCGVLLLATFLNYMDRQALAVTLPEMKQRYNLHEGRIGRLEMSFGLAFAAGSVAFGWLADRLGPRALYPLVLVGWSAAGVATGFAGDAAAVGLLEGPDDEPGAGTFRWLLVCRTLLGLFEAGHWPCALIAARRVLSPAERPLGNGILQSGASLGAILIPLYVQLVEHLGGGWQMVFWSVGVGGLVWVPLWLGLVRPGDLAADPAPAPDAPTAPPLPAGEFARRLVVLGVVVSCLTVSWQFLRAWLALFLQDFHEYPPLQARLAVTGYFISADVGCILVGFVVVRLVKVGLGVHAARVWTFALFAGLTAAAAAVPWLGSGPLMVAGLMVAGAGILGLHPLYYALSQELPAKRMGVLSGGLAAAGWVVSAVNQVAVGDHIKATKSYDVGLVIAGLAPLLGLVALLALWRSSADEAR
ncbi:MAG TPA: MFS transporter [Urbifossiella sp.]|nr:MFS transporter [Urbifossiella sp.]